MKFLRPKKDEKAKHFFMQDIVRRTIENHPILKENLPIVEIHFDRMKELFREHRRAIFGVLTLVISLSILSAFSMGHASVTNFYPTSCLGGWEHPENAQGEPDLPEGSSLESFSISNSARLDKSSGSIFCGSFKGEVLDNTQPTNFHLSFSWSVDDGSVNHNEVKPFENVSNTDQQNINTIDTNSNSTDTNNSSTTDTNNNSNINLIEVPNNPDNSVNVPSQDSAPAEQAPAPDPSLAPAPESAPADNPVSAFLYNIFSTKVFAQENTTPTPAPEPSPTPVVEQSTPDIAPVIVSDPTATSIEAVPVVEPITLPDAITNTDTTNTTSDINKINQDNLLKTELNSDKINQDAFAEVEYTLDGTDWKSLGTISRSQWQNASFDIPLDAWANLDNLQISIKTLPTYDTPAVIYLDAMKMSVEYQDIKEILNRPTVELKDSSIVISNPQQDFNSSEDVNFTINTPNLNINDIKDLVNNGTAEVVDDKAGVLTDTPVIDNTTSNNTINSIKDIVKPTADSLNTALPNNLQDSQIIVLPDIPKKEEDKTINTTEIKSIDAPVSFLDFLKTKKALADTPDVTAKVLDLNGDDTDINARVINVNINGIDKQQVQITKGREFKPGKYTLKVTVNTPQAIIVSQQDFTWGVLSINTNKSIFEIGDDAYLQMGVLNDGGHTICDADLNLSITSPSGSINNFSTGNNSIIRESQCGPDNVISVPDYYAHFNIPNEVGTYKMKLTANTYNGIKTINDTFEVSSNSNISVERIGPTRIWPLANYPMLIKVTANNNWQGTVSEFVPESFDILAPENGENFNSVDTIEDPNNPSLQVKKISWNVNLIAGQTIELGYIFDAPNISPEYYVLGKIQLNNNGNISFEESRNWQIASDAACNATATGTWGGTDTASFTSCTGAATTGTGTGNRPGIADALTINSGVTVTLSASASVGSITMAVATAANGLTISTGATLTVTTSSGGTGAITYTGNTTANAQTITLNGTGSISAVSMVLNVPTSTGGSKFTCAAGSGSLTLSSTLTLTGNSTTTGTNVIAMDTCTLSVGGLLSINGGTNATGVASVTSSTGTITALAGLSFGNTVANTRFTTTGAGIFNLTGTMQGAGIVSFNAGTTVNISGTSAISAAYTFPIVNITSGTTTLGNVGITFSGLVTVSGSLASNGATGTKAFSGGVMVNSGGSFNLSGVATITTFAGTLTASTGATAFNSGTGAVTFTAATTLAGTVAMSFGGAVTINAGVIVTNNNTSATGVTFSTLTITGGAITANTGLSLSTGTVTSTTTTLTIGANQSTGAFSDTITMNGTATLTVGTTATFTIPTTTVAGAKEGIIAASGASGTLTINGTTTINGGATGTQFNGIDLSLGTNAFTSAAVTLTGGAAGTASLTMGTGALTINGNVTFGTAGNISRSVITTGASAITLNNCTLGASGTLSWASATSFTTTGTVALNGAIYTFPMLTVSTGTTTLGGADTISNNLVVSANATLKFGGFGFTVSGTSSISGSVICPAAATCTGAKTFTGAVTINSGGSFNLSTGAPSVVATTIFGSDITMASSAISFNTHTGATTFNATSTLSGPVAMTFGGTVTLGTANAATITNSNTSTVTFGALTLFNGAGGAENVSLSDLSTTTVTGAISFTANNRNFSQTITMNGNANLNAGSLSIPAPSNTGLSTITCNAGTGTFTITGAATITGNSTSTGNSSLAMSSCNLSVGGLLTLTGGTNATGTAGVTSSTGNVTILAGLTFTTANVANTRFTKTSTGTIQLTGTMTGAGIVSINSGATFNTSGIATLSTSTTFPNLNVLDGTTKLGAVAITFTGASNISGSVICIAAASCTGLKTFTGDVTVNAGGLFDLNVGTPTVTPTTSFGGNITNNGTGVLNTGISTSSTTTFTGSPTLSGSMGMTFWTVTVASGLSITNSNTATVTFQGNFILASGSLGISLSDLSTTTVTGTTSFNANSSASNMYITMNGNANLNLAIMNNTAPTGSGNTGIFCNNGTGTMTTTGAVTFIGNSTSTGTMTMTMGSCHSSFGGLLTLTGGTNATGVAALTASTGNITLGAGLTFSGTVADTRFTKTSTGTIQLTGLMAGAGIISINSGATFNTSGTAGFNTAITLPNLNVLDGTTSLGGVAITISGATNVTGSLVGSSSSNPKTFSGLVTVNAASSFDLSGGALYTVVNNFNAGITMNGTSFNTSAGATTITASQNLSGSGPIIFGGAVTISSGFTLTNNNTGTVDFNSTITGGNGSSNFATGLNSNTNFASTVMATGILTPGTVVNTVAYDGGTQTIKIPTTNPYYNLSVTAAGVKSLAAITTVTGTTNISAGTLDTTLASHYNLTTGNMTIGVGGTFLPQASTVTVTGNWSNSGTFTAGTSTVLMNGGNTATVSGTTTFNNFTITHTGAKEVDFQTAGSPVFHVTGIFTVTGSLGNLITLRSDATPTKWTIDPTGTANADYLDVMDGGCFSGAITINTSNLTNSGNNDACWLPTAITFSFSNDNSNIGFGTLSSSNICYANATGGSVGSDVVAHSLNIITNAAYGYTLTYFGNTLTSGGNTISPAVNISAGSIGQSEFALSGTMITSGTGAMYANYNHATPKWSFVSGTTTPIASSSGPVTSDTVEMHYLANISDTTPAGNYSTTITYIATGNF
ncbi:MAG: hypothetical protein NT068_04145 [Candidatus Nomurabacteria bacterium]|nr:hypothetical protein [Candidatus Nomurabacteria bacterium]